MKALATIFAALALSAPAHAVVMENAAQLPAMVCESAASQALVYPSADEKQSLIVVEMAREDGEMVEVFQTPAINVVADQGSMFVSSDVNLYVVPVSGGLKGFLRMNPDQPGVAMPMNCHVVMTIQPIDATQAM